MKVQWHRGQVPACKICIQNQYGPLFHLLWPMPLLLISDAHVVGITSYHTPLSLKKNKRLQVMSKSLLTEYVKKKVEKYGKINRMIKSGCSARHIRYVSQSQLSSWIPCLVITQKLSFSSYTPAIFRLFKHNKSNLRYYNIIPVVLALKSKAKETDYLEIKAY